LAIAWIDENVLTALGKEPSIPVDGVLMSKHSMYYDAAKAVRDLGLPQSPVKTALQDAVSWFRQQGYVQG
jgi:dihydroflavonol-4-reductase